MNTLFHTIRERVRSIRKSLKVLFIFGWIVLSFILLQIGIANSHRMGKSEQQAVTALEKLVIGIGEDGTVRLVTATLDDQVRSVDRYPLESGVTDLPDSLPVTEQTRIRYPWAVAVSQGKLFVFDLRSIVAENTPCQAVCDRQKLYIAYVDGETASIAIVDFSDGIPVQIEKGFPKQIAELPYKFAVTSDGIRYLRARREGEERYPTQCLTDHGVTIENVPYIFTGNGRLYAAAFTGLMMKEGSEFVKLVPWSRLREVDWYFSSVEPIVQFINDRYLYFKCSTELPVYRTISYYVVVDTKNCTWCTIDQEDDHWHDLYDSLYN